MTKEDVGDFKDGDIVVVKKTGKTTEIDGIGRGITPPIWCKDGKGYFAKELRKTA